jgi:hypothetical protein
MDHLALAIRIDLIVRVVKVLERMRSVLLYVPLVRQIATSDLWLLILLGPPLAHMVSWPQRASREYI